MPKTFWEIWVDVRLGLVHDELPTAYVYKRLRCLWTESWQSFVFVKEKRKKSNISCCKSIPRKISLSRRPWNKWCCVNPSRQTILLWSLIIISILSEIRCFLDIYRNPVSSLAIVQSHKKAANDHLWFIFSIYSVTMERKAILFQFKLFLIKSTRFLCHKNRVWFEEFRND